MHLANSRVQLPGSMQPSLNFENGGKICSRRCRRGAWIEPRLPERRVPVHIPLCPTLLELGQVALDAIDLAGLGLPVGLQCAAPVRDRLG